MGFRGSENHLCAYHNILVMFYHVVNSIKFTKLTSIGDLSFLDYRSETQKIFSARAFRL